MVRHLSCQLCEKTQCCHRRCKNDSQSSCFNSIKRTQLRIMHTTFNGNNCTIIAPCYSPTNARDELDITIFYDRLSSLARHIPKDNILIIGANRNAQIGKDEKIKFCLCNLLNRNGKYQLDFSLKDSLSCLSTKFHKEKNYGPTPTHIKLKHS